MRLDVVIIDPQIDFCAPPNCLYAGHPGGSLYVPNAEKSMQRLAAFITRLGAQIEAIHVTLDTHSLFDVAHPIYWRDREGRHPEPFTLISASEVADGRWVPSQPDLYARSLEYVRALEQRGRYTLCIWPPHCLIGSIGHGVFPPLLEALQQWEASQLRTVHFISKGTNPFTEHYSAVQAEVPDPADPTTQLNTRLIRTLEAADLVVWAGEAGSHCVANTLRDVFDHLSDSRSVEKMVLLEDAMDPVPGFESYQESFLREARERGMRVTTTQHFSV